MGQDLIALWTDAMVMIEEGVAPEVVARKVKSTVDHDDRREFRELVAAALAIACLGSAPERAAGVELPDGITLEQLMDEAWQRGRDARKLASLWMVLSMSERPA
jgi:hypothetical protein